MGEDESSSFNGRFDIETVVMDAVEKQENAVDLHRSSRRVNVHSHRTRRTELLQEQNMQGDITYAGEEPTLTIDIQPANTSDSFLGRPKWDSNETQMRLHKEMSGTKNISRKALQQIWEYK
jgi:hypothetical protein